MPSFDIPVGFKRAFHSQPEDTLNNPVVPSSNVTWSVVPATGVVNLAPAGLQTEDCWISAVALGSSTVTISQGGVTSVLTVNVVPVPLDHFAPVADGPVAL